MSTQDQPLCDCGCGKPLGQVYCWLRKHKKSFLSYAHMEEWEKENEHNSSQFEVKEVTKSPPQAAA